MASSLKVKDLDDNQLLGAIQELIERYRHIHFDAISMDGGTWKRIIRVLTVGDKTYRSMSGDHFLFGKKVLFTKRAGVQLLFREPHQAEFKL